MWCGMVSCGGRVAAGGLSGILRRPHCQPPRPLEAPGGSSGDLRARLAYGSKCRVDGCSYHCHYHHRHRHATQLALGATRNTRDRLQYRAGRVFSRLAHVSFPSGRSCSRPPWATALGSPHPQLRLPPFFCDRALNWQLRHASLIAPGRAPAGGRTGDVITPHDASHLRFEFFLRRLCPRRCECVRMPRGLFTA